MAVGCASDSSDVLFVYRVNCDTPVMLILLTAALTRQTLGSVACLGLLELCSIQSCLSVISVSLRGSMRASGYLP